MLFSMSFQQNSKQTDVNTDVIQSGQAQAHINSHFQPRMTLISRCSNRAQFTTSEITNPQSGLNRKTTDHQKRSVVGSCNRAVNSLTTSAIARKRLVTIMIGKFPNVIEMLLNCFEEAIIGIVL